MSKTVHLRIEYDGRVYETDPEPSYLFDMARTAVNGEANNLKSNIDGNPTYFPKSILENSIITVVVTEEEPS